MSAATREKEVKGRDRRIRELVEHLYNLWDRGAVGIVMRMIGDLAPLDAALVAGHLMTMMLADEKAIFLRCLNKAERSSL